jgi:2-polyprenyl-3-methyl-5-hydroxy-6-metoxy-1,4-benzoquinol methylase
VNSVVDFDTVYRGAPPWDIGRPQREFVQLEEAGEIVGSILDVGCGTGENALFFAAQGHDVWGVDFSPLAIEKARNKAAARNLAATFLTRSALELNTLGRQFDTIIDSGLFHVLNDEERPLFVTNLAGVLRRYGSYFVLCFSELEPGTYGPRRVTQAEIRNAFSHGWHVNYIRPAHMESRQLINGVHAWLSSVSKQ